MKRSMTLLLILLAITACNKDSRENTANQQPDSTPMYEDKADYYNADTYSTDEISIPYRYLHLNSDADEGAILVTLLHGGSKKGTDNVAQLSVPALDSLENYLRQNHTNAILLAPQCPTTSWTSISSPLKSLIDYISAINNIQKKYIFGFSMGGAGTWKMVNDYSGYFTSAGIAAGNPNAAGAVADNVKATPVYAIAGSEDTIGKANVIRQFIFQVSQAGGDAKFDLLEGCDHVATCTQAFNTERISWIISHHAL